MARQGLGGLRKQLGFVGEGGGHGGKEALAVGIGDGKASVPRLLRRGPCGSPGTGVAVALDASGFHVVAHPAIGAVMGGGDA